MRRAVRIEPIMHHPLNENALFSAETVYRIKTAYFSGRREQYAVRGDRSFWKIASY